MSVEAFRIQNFMGFEDSGWVELQPIGLLFGRNSSGKSALIRALRLLKLSLYALPSNGPLVFVGEEGLDQGSFRETVHGSDHKYAKIEWRRDGSLVRDLGGDICGWWSSPQTAEPLN
ncbi:MAG: hypothetical protein ACPGWR_04235 [Ardenticatenaceae bacterium]